MSELKSSSQPIVIAGMHRSGTSLTASILEQAGVFIGDQLLKANVGNQLGHFEDEDFLSLHKDILTARGISFDGWSAVGPITVPQQFWERAQTLCDRRLTAHQLWGWKEPRTTLFLDFWTQILPQAKFIFPYRSPWEVIDSLFTRGDPIFRNNPNFATEVWQTYNQSLLNFYEHHSERCFLFHCDLLKADERGFIEKINSKFGLSLNVPDESLFQPGAMHTAVNQSHRPALLFKHFPETFNIYERLQRLADVPTAQKLSVEMSQTEASYRDWVLQDWQLSSHLSTQLKQTKKQLEDTTTQLQYTEAELQQTQVLLHQAQTEATHWQQTTEAMEANRFWKMRNAWLSLKKATRFWQSQ